MRIVTIFVISLVFECNVLLAQELPSYKLDSVVVSAGFRSFNSFQVARSVSSVLKSDIDKLPAANLPELLKSISGVDIRRRGVGSTQADLSIRGSSFEQTLVLIDGVAITDGQTGHHVLDIPIEQNDIAKVEVLKGSGSRLFGANAFGGSVNFIMNRNSNNGITLRGAFGSSQSMEGSVSMNKVFAASSHDISFSASKSDGYRYNTDFGNWSGSYRFNLSSDSTHLFLTTGISEKKFGANSFYSSAYPDQWEHTKSGFMIAGLDYRNIDLRFIFKLHDDEYLLYKDHPEIYRNHHIKNNLGFRAKYSAITDYGYISGGIETGIENITSNNLGNHTRRRLNLFFENQFEVISKMIVSVGSGFHFSSDWNTNYSPGLDVSFRFSDYLVTYASCGYSFRVPTYTELYYKSPLTVGSSNLRPEKALSYEIGMRFGEDNFITGFALFERDGKDLIDWVKEKQSSVWIARNFTKVNITGFELNGSIEYPFKKIVFLKKISMNYMYMKSSKDFSALMSTYVLDHLNHQILLNVEHKIFLGIVNCIIARYEERAESEKYFLCDLKMQKDIGMVTISINAMNIFDKYYTEVGGIPMPGRFLSCGLKTTI